MPETTLDAVEEIAVVQGAQAAEMEGGGAGAAAGQGEADGAGHGRALRGEGTGPMRVGGVGGVAAGPPVTGPSAGRVDCGVGISAVAEAVRVARWV